MEYQMLSDQIKQMEEHLMQLERHTVELEQLMESFNYLDTVKENKEVLIPLGAGVFFKGIKSSDQKIIMSVGAGVCVDKSLLETKEVLNTQLAEVREIISQIEINLNYLSSKEKELKKSAGHSCSCGDHKCSC